jgi:hypothetical protein
LVSGDAIGHGWRDYRELLLLARTDGRRRSLFDASGLIEQSARTERFLLWPSGILSPGTMRQAGTQAIAVLGRRHFDDAQLLDRFLLDF